MERTKIYDKTLLIKSTDDEGIRDAAEKLRNGEVVGFPTETVYGLGCNAFDKDAVTKVFEAKGRPSDNPLICHVADKETIKEAVKEIPQMAAKMIDAFMPGPITLIMPKSDKIPDEVTAGLKTVGVRMPSDPVAAKFIKACACPVAAPSANLSGRPSPTTSERVMEDMDGYVYAVIDGGDSVFGLESTVVDCTGERPVILRPGAVTAEAISQVTGNDAAFAGTLEAGDTPKAPGMKYRHYAPSCPVEIIDFPEGIKIEGDDWDGNLTYEPDRHIKVDFDSMSEEEKQEIINCAFPFMDRVKKILAQNPLARIGIYAGAEVAAVFELLEDDIIEAHTEIFGYGNLRDVRAASHYLFEGLRHLDLQDVTVILAQGMEGEGLAKAYGNRLGKAAAPATGVVGDNGKGQRQQLPLDYFKDTYTAQVLFADDKNTGLSCVCDAVFSSMLEKNSPYRARVSEDIGCEIYCESAGTVALTGSRPDEKTAAAVKEVTGKDITFMEAVRLAPAVYDESDLVLALNDDIAFDIVATFPELKDKVFSLSSYAAKKGLVFKDAAGNPVSLAIKEPEGGADEYVHAVKALSAWLDILFPYILKDLGVERV